MDEFNPTAVREALGKLEAIEAEMAMDAMAAGAGLGSPVKVAAPSERPYGNGDRLFACSECGDSWRTNIWRDREGGCCPNCGTDVNVTLIKSGPSK